MNTATHPVSPETVMAFLDGELSASESASISAHINSCPDCSALAEKLRGFSQRIATWEIESCPPRVEAFLNPARLQDHSSGTAALGGVPTQRPQVFKFVLGVASGFAVLVLLAAISIPNLLKSRMAANEASAAGTLRTLNNAAVAYYSTYGHFPPSLQSLGPSVNGEPSQSGAGLIDAALARGLKSGYRFTYQLFGNGYMIRAEALDPGRSGIRHFSTDETAVIRAGGTPLEGDLAVNSKAQAEAAANKGGFQGYAGRMIVQTAELKLTVENLDVARVAIDQILARHGAYIGQLSANAESGSERTASATLRVPADQLDVCIVELKKLGRVTHESLSGEEVTPQHSDLVARLKNAHNTESRLNSVVEQHGGKVTDVLDVEKEIARVRGEIEQMEAEQKTLEHRVTFATVNLQLNEEYKAPLGSAIPPTSMRLHNALVAGYRDAVESLISVLLFFAQTGPFLLLWFALLFLPARWACRRWRHAYAHV